MKTHKINFPKLTIRKVLVILTILAFIVTSTIYAKIEFYRCPDPKPLWLEMLYYSTQILGSLFVTGGVIIAVWQYYLSVQSTRTSLAMEQVQKAIDLSEYYKDNILNSYPAIRYIFDNSGISEIIETIKPDQFNDFDKHELDKLFTPKDISALQNLTETDQFFRSVMEANEIYGLNLNLLTEKTLIKTESHAEISVKISKTSIVVAFTANLINAILNNLEFFALHFRHNTADESVVYQSLHQSYLRMIPYMYYYIAKQNEDPSNKLYTNVIWLFIYWRDKKKQQDENRSKKVNEIQSHGTIINNHIL